MKKKIMAIVLASMVLASSVACEKEVKVEPERPETPEVEAIEKGITVVNHPLEATMDGEVMATASYPEIILCDDYAKKYPKLNDAINGYNEYWADSSNESANAYARMRKSDREEGIEEDEYSVSTSLEVVRFDDRLFTVLYDESYQSGACTGDYNISYNIDVATGNLVSITTVVDDGDAFAKAVRGKMDEKYPTYKDEYDKYFCAGEELGDAFEYKFDNDNYTWTLTEEGLHLYFGSYEVQDVDDSKMDVVLSTEEIKDIINPVFLPKENTDIDSMVEIKTADVVTFEAEDEEYLWEEPNGDVHAGFLVPNHTWKKYVSEYCKQAAEKHISLTQLSMDKTDWLDTEVWAEKNGFEMARLPYSDGTYDYEPYNPGEYSYENQSIVVYNQNREVVIDLDLSQVCNGPDETDEKWSCATQYINWAQIDGDYLYLSIGHGGYTSEESWTGYIVAIDLNINDLVWRSEPLVSNNSNFKIVDDTIICGYGFTSEPDYLYLLDKHTGDRVDKIRLVSAPAQFEVKDDILYLATYDTSYEFKINR